MSRVSALATTGGYADLHSLLASTGLAHWSLPASSVVLTPLGLWVYRHRHKDVWLLLGVTAFVARFWTYHGWYDDLIILLPMVALFRIAKQEPANGLGILASGILSITLLLMLAPGGLYLLPPPWKMLYVTGQIVVWMIGLIALLYLTQRENKHAG